MKRPRGRPPVAAPKTANRYSINYDDVDNALVVAAAKRAGEPFVGRWIARAALYTALRERRHR